MSTKARIEPIPSGNATSAGVSPPEHSRASSPHPSSRSAPSKVSREWQGRRLAPGLADLAERIDHELAATDLSRFKGADLVHLSKEELAEANREIVAKLQREHPELTAEDLFFLRGEGS